MAAVWTCNLVAHKFRNLGSKVPENVWPEFKARASACHQAASPALARLLPDDIVATYGKAQGSALGGGTPQRRLRGCIAHLRFLRPSSRDSNNKPARATVRRGAAAHPGNPARLPRARRAEADVCRIDPSGGLLREIRITEFEQRQLDA